MEAVKSLVDRIGDVEARAEENKRENDKLKVKVDELTREAEENKKENEKLKVKVDELTRVVNGKDGQISELLAEISDMKDKLKEMGSDMYKCQLKLKEKDENEEVIKQANTILQKEKEFEESVDKVHSVKEEIKTTFAEILKQKDEMKNSQMVEKQQASQIDIRQEVKDVIRKNAKLLRETVDMNKSIVIIGSNEENIQNKFLKDKADLKNILEIANKVLDEEVSGKDIEEFHRLGKYEANKNRPIKVTFQSTNMMEEVLRKAIKLHEEEEFKNVFIRRCLSREDRELLRGKLEEAKGKNAERSEEEAQVFFYKVVGMQVKKWYKNKRE